MKFQNPAISLIYDTNPINLKRVISYYPFQSRKHMFLLLSSFAIQLKQKHLRGKGRRTARTHTSALDPVDALPPDYDGRVHRVGSLVLRAHPAAPAAPNAIAADA